MPNPSRSGDRPTVKDVAAAAGVSATTVSRVLAGNYPVSTAVRTRVLRAVRELDYVVNAQARSLVSGSPRTVAFVVRDLVGPSFALVGQGVEQQATAEGRLCLVCATHGDRERELELVETMREQRAEAVVLVGGGHEGESHAERMRQVARALDRSGSRLVLCGRPPLGDDVPATVVHYDNEGGAYAMTSHLLSLGHREIVFLGGEESGYTTSTERIGGFLRAHRDHGVPVPAERMVYGSFGHEFGYTATRRLLAQGVRFTAVFAATDMSATGVLTALREAGVSVPGEVSVVGYDDITLSAIVTPALTTVHVPHEELGSTAVRLALHRDRHVRSQHTVLGTHVVIRESSGPPPRQAVTS
ncbi:LacI family DNA-binding transcriptional regulator [Streptomyces sp. AS02]|uniref:LacI family DNA-binding transcriptional regulator n=1 Tax=Streptomyces sp. AS02 TaxID=2938946 RepID=UPI0020222C4D|nr:LacI family DNA-binding transcriptional regulator [Streptomyces sp. AS02]MCL8014943.1 LacI family transcriptional regulator [Streptomyces sp. AS02]